MSSLHTKSAIDLTKTPFQLHATQGPKKLLLGRRQLATEIFSWSPDGKCGREIVSKNFSFMAKDKNGKYSRRFLHENIPTPERSQESDSVCKGIKMSCS